MTANAANPLDMLLTFLTRASMVAGVALLAVIVAICVVVHKGDP